MAEKLTRASIHSKTTKAAPHKSVATSKAAAPSASPEQIAKLAHRFWAERGHQHGHHEEDWFRAEQELLGKAS
jgi:hypothetical protein